MVSGTRKIGFILMKYLAGKYGFQGYFMKKVWWFIPFQFTGHYWYPLLQPTSFFTLWSTQINFHQVKEGPFPKGGSLFNTFQHSPWALEGSISQV